MEWITRKVNSLCLLGFFILLTCSACYSQPFDKFSVQFKKHTLTRDFISEGVAVGDINKDGKIDIIAGAYWFEAPDWTPHEIFPGETFDPAEEYSNSMHNLAMDVNLDGWLDLVLIGFPGSQAAWYENPKNKEGHWKRHHIYELVGAGNESPGFVDVDGDGRLDLLVADSNKKQMIWLRAPKAEGATDWEKFTISEVGAPGTDIFSHGLGLGDINSDGNPDVIIKEGWWEAPDDPEQPGWTFHEADLGEDCSHMHVLDVNGDSYNDVISASAHRYGIWWYEQGRDAGGNRTWKRHEISSSFSQTHASAMTDLNSDNHPDLVTGKRYFAHNNAGFDPGAEEPAVLYWFEHTPGQEPFWTAHEIDDDSGAGLNIVTQDITKNGLTDIVVANKKGVFLFENLTEEKGD